MGPGLGLGLGQGLGQGQQCLVRSKEKLDATKARSHRKLICGH